MSDNRSMSRTVMPFDIERAARNRSDSYVLFLHSMTGTVMPFDLERTGRDLRQATCLITGLIPMFFFYIL